MERASLVPRILILDKENAGFSKISSKTKGYTKKNNAFLYLLRSKRFRLVSEQSKTEERDFWFLAVRKMEREPLFARSTWKQPPPQAPRFSQGRGERLVMNRKGLWKGSSVVSFPPSFARTFSSRERERDVRVRGRNGNVCDTGYHISFKHKRIQDPPLVIGC